MTAPLQVVCDICGTDFTGLTDSGGLHLPPVGYIGPCCATPEHLRWAAERHPTDVCPGRVPFAVWVAERRRAEVAEVAHAVVRSVREHNMRRRGLWLE